MSLPSIALALLAASATLTTTLAASAPAATLSIPFFGYDGDSFAASVVSAAPSATVLVLACPTATPDCGLFPYQTLTYGPSTYHMDMSVDGNGFTMTQDCKREASSAVCAESASGAEANDPGSSTETYEYDATDLAGVQVVVTQGADMLGATSAAAPSASASATQSQSQSAQTGLTTSARSTPTPGAAPSAGASPSASGAKASPSPSGNAAAGLGVAHGRLFAGLGLLGGLLV